MKKFNIFLLLILYSCSCTNPANHYVNRPLENIPEITYSVIKILPHDTTSFTEGFVVYNNQLFESTGSPDNIAYTKSLFGTVDTITGKINAKAELDKSYFGEGIAFLNDTLFQLTYRSQTCFVYDAATFKQLKKFNYVNKQGWGLTSDGKHLIMSDGTNNLSFINPVDFQIIKTLTVTANNYAVDRLNELEYIKGFIYANVYTNNDIVKIDPANGIVLAKINLSGLKESVNRTYNKALETNGIAYDSIADKIYVTGKMWPNIYQIEFNH